MFSLLEKIPKIFAWLQIAISPIIAGVLAGALMYLLIGGRTGVILALMLIIGGFAAGIAWAINISRKKGTVEHMARNLATPELDHSRNHQNLHSLNR